MANSVFKSIATIRLAVLGIALFAHAGVLKAQDYKGGLRALRAGLFDVALEQLRPLAQQGHPYAQYHLGIMYEYGRGVARSDAIAANWYLSAAKADIAFAQYRLGVLHDNGWGIEKDTASAVRWYKSAAEQGHLLAQHDLAFMYLSGNGVEKNPVQAYMWMRVAVGAGDERMVKHLALIARELSVSEIERGKALARRWRQRK